MTTDNRGFASLTPEQRKEMSSRGGKARAAKGVGHIWTSEEGKEAGAKGGRKSQADRKETEDGEGIVDSGEGGTGPAKGGGTEGA